MRIEDELPFLVFLPVVVDLDGGPFVLRGDAGDTLTESLTIVVVKGARDSGGGLSRLGQQVLDHVGGGLLLAAGLLLHLLLALLDLLLQLLLLDLLLIRLLLEWRLLLILLRERARLVARLAGLRIHGAGLIRLTGLLRQGVDRLAARWWRRPVAGLWLGLSIARVTGLRLGGGLSVAGLAGLRLVAGLPVAGLAGLGLISGLTIAGLTGLGLVAGLAIAGLLPVLGELLLVVIRARSHGRRRAVRVLILVVLILVIRLAVRV